MRLCCTNMSILTPDPRDSHVSHEHRKMTKRILEWVLTVDQPPRRRLAAIVVLVLEVEEKTSEEEQDQYHFDPSSISKTRTDPRHPLHLAKAGNDRQVRDRNEILRYSEQMKSTSPVHSVVSQGDNTI